MQLFFATQIHELVNFELDLQLVQCIICTKSILFWKWKGNISWWKFQIYEWTKFFNKMKWMKNENKMKMNEIFLGKTVGDLNKLKWIDLSWLKWNMTRFIFIWKRGFTNSTYQFDWLHYSRPIFFSSSSSPTKRIFPWWISLFRVPSHVQMWYFYSVILKFKKNLLYFLTNIID